MPTPVFTCAQGHEWQSAASSNTCPQCGGPHLTVAVRPDTVEADSEAATVPPRAPLEVPTPATQPRHEPKPALELPSIAGYEVLDVLGRGGMGIVYKARQIQLKRLVALKMILSGGHASIGELSRFRIEAEAVARLQHPNIVQIYEVGEQDGRPYLALEFVDGESLTSKRVRSRLSPEGAARLVASLGRAMHVAHERGVVHRDLKPANILIAADGTPKITDFGLAKHLDSTVEHTSTGTVMGTPSYMAPEQAGGHSRDIGPPVDIYALGAVLYELLTGRPPFLADTPLDTLMHVVADEPVPPRRLQPRLPRDLETICLKCLEKEPRRRYATAQDLADDLQRFLEGEAIVARPPGPVGRLLRWASRVPAFASTVIALAFFYLSHLIFLFLFGGLVPGQGGDYHWFVTGLCLAWAAGAALFQWLLRRPEWHRRAIAGWVTMEVLFFTLLLFQGEGPVSALLVCYLLLLGGAALRFQVALLWYVAGICLVSYWGLIYACRSRPELKLPVHVPIIFSLSILLMTFILHLLLRRIKKA